MIKELLATYLLLAITLKAFAEAKSLGWQLEIIDSPLDKPKSNAKLVQLASTENKLRCI